jgi:hypothetical protein
VIIANRGLSGLDAALYMQGNIQLRRFLPLIPCCIHQQAYECQAVFLSFGRVHFTFGRVHFTVQYRIHKCVYGTQSDVRALFPHGLQTVQRRRRRQIMPKPQPPDPKSQTLDPGPSNRAAMKATTDPGTALTSLAWRRAVRLRLLGTKKRL